MVFNYGMRLPLLKVPPSSGASKTIVNVGKPTGSAVLCNLRYGCMCGASDSALSAFVQICDLTDAAFHYY